MNLCRVLFCYLAFVSPVLANDIYDRGDAWEYSNFTGLFATPAYLDNVGTFSPEDVFGGVLSTREDANGENGHYCFGDSPAAAVALANSLPVHAIDVVEFQTARKTPLLGYKVYMGTEYTAVLRTTTKVVLFSKKDASSDYVEVHSFIPTYLPVSRADFSGGMSETTNMLSKMVVSKFWKIEFHRETNVNLGARIIEVDAITAENVDPTELNVLSPQEGESFESPSQITFNVEAEDEDGIDEISVTANGSPVGSRLDSGPIVWQNPAPGSYGIRVTAVDGLGGETFRDFRIEVVEKAPEIRLSNPRVEQNNLHFNVNGYTVGAYLNFYSSENLKDWTLEKSDFTTEPTWTFTMPFLGKKFFKVSETR